MAIKIEMLRCFVEVVQGGGLSVAAKRLGRTPSAVSMMLKQFEENVGAPLFETERKSRLTVLGQYTFKQAERELAHFDECIASITEFARATSGLVRVASVPSVATKLMPGAVKRFRDTHPSVMLDIQDMRPNAVIRALEDEQADLGIVSGTVPATGFESLKLGYDRLGILAHKDHPLVLSGTPVDWSVVKQWPFIGNHMCEYVDAPEVKEANDSATLVVRNTTSLLSLVREGIGITVIPEMSAHAPGSQLRFIAPQGPEQRREISLLTRSGRSLSPAAEEFVLSVREEASA